MDHLGWETVFYSVWDGQQWSPFNDIVVPGEGIVRHAIAVDAADNLHFVFGWLTMQHKQAPSNEALSAKAWTLPALVNSRRGTYMKDIAIYQDTLHVLYDDYGAGNVEGECPKCADIFYRRSPDRGLTWSEPISLFPTDHIGSARVQIEIDRTGTIYVTWDEGWDRLSDQRTPQKTGVYMYSADGGYTWSTPSIISYPNLSNTQLTVGSNGLGGVILVWRTESKDYPGIFYMWSEDYGQSWSPPQ
ncbi:MAG: exo-alpha-sialidase, partial [Chloroflexi bacterium]|nr:exo-alpha-sialidase [Chloroflexota bacterium]